MIDAYATQVSYLNHLAPIMRALPAHRRGVVHVEMNKNEMAPFAAKHGLVLAPARPRGRDHDADPVLIAGGADLQAGWSGRPVVFVEHGAGQTYQGLPDVATYSGGMGRDSVSLFLSPNEAVAARNRARYPNADHAVVGDPTIRARTPEGLLEPVVAFSWHWDFNSGPPEARTTWPYWADEVLRLAAEETPYRVLGHAHPKIQYRIMPWWAENLIPASRHWSTVSSRASVFVADNTSCLYEFAATGRPVVVLDHPSYRRDVEHGLRFWEHADVGVRISDPADLHEAILTALADPPHVARRRQEIVEQVYAYVGDEAKWRAVDAILDRWPDAV